MYAGVVANWGRHRQPTLPLVHLLCLSSNTRMTLEILLLGQPQLRLNGQLITEINANKALALLYYLATTQRPHSRQGLAGLLWSELPEESARRNLRVELNRLRNVFGDYVIGERESLYFNRHLSSQLDLARFEAIVQTPDAPAEHLRAALDLYRGDFLEDFHVREAALFEEWQLSEQERLRQATQQLTTRLIQLDTQNKNYASAIEYANRLLLRSPWHEEAHQQLMQLYARTGQRSMALTQYERCCRALDEEYGVPPSSETNALYDRILSGEIGPDPADEPSTLVSLVARPATPPFQAPAQLLHFVGREAELAELQAALLQATGGATIALVGMGGIGKSTLAGQVAHQLRAEFPDGVLWANIATSDPIDVLGHWARALGYDFSTLGDVENRAAALRSVLADKRLLLILDDVRSVARTRPLLVGGSQCIMLLTTRDLDVAHALNAQPHRLGELDHAASLRLLARILTEARVNAEPDAAQAICYLLQHLPLAVEITAQRLASRPRRRLADMAERLRHVEERLDLSISDRAVRTSFQVSWESLDGNQRRVFALLGVFAGRSFTAPALAHIAGLDIYTAEDRLFALTALSLVGEEDNDRYRQHPLLADFASEQLGDNRLPQVDMALYYQSFAESNRTNYLALRPEWENLMAGIELAHQLHQWPLVLTYAEALTQAWFVRARYTQARQGYALAYEAAHALSDEANQAAMLLSWGQACLEQNDYREAKARLSECLMRYERLEEEAGIANAAFLLGRIAVEQGDYPAAEAHLALSQQLRSELNDPIAVAATLYQQGLLAYRRSDFDQADALTRQALTIQEQMDDLAGSLPTLRLLADIAVEHKTYPLAEERLNRCLRLAEQLQDRSELAAAYYGLAVVSRFQDKQAESERYIAHVLELSQWMGNRQYQAMALYEQFLLYRRTGQVEAALQAGLKSRDLFEALADQFNLVFVLDNLAVFLAEQSQLEQALRFWQEALELALKLEHPLTEKLRQRSNQMMSAEPNGSF